MNSSEPFIRPQPPYGGDLTRPRDLAGSVAIVVDDQQISRMALVRIVSEIGDTVQVVAFQGAVQALEFVLSHDVDLVITDYAMPGMDGLALIERLRSLPRTRHVPIVVTTVFGDKAVKQRALELGATDFLAKPIYPQECRARCQNLLELSRGRKQLEAYVTEMDAMRAEQTRIEQDRLRAAQEEAAAVTRSATQAKMVFLAMASHELRTPLQAIILKIDLIELIARRHPDLLRHLRGLRQAADELQCVARDLGEFVRVESGYAKLEPHSIILRQFAAEVAEPYRQQALSKGLAFHLIVDDQHITVQTDPIRLRQIASNLLSNAVKYTLEGSITFSVGCARAIHGTTDLTISVTDTGVGIPAHVQAEIMRPFVRVDVASVPKQHGLGLGLAVVNALVSVLGGTVSVQSAMGEGSCFTASLPVIAGEEKTEPPQAPHAEAARPIRVAIIDDNQPTRDAMAELLSNSPGVECEAAPDGIAGLELLRSRCFDVLLVDLQMPEMSGYEVAKRARKAARDPQRLRIIAMSAYELDPQHGSIFDAFLPKPIAAAQLCAALGVQSAV